VTIPSTSAQITGPVAASAAVRIRVRIVVVRGQTYQSQYRPISSQASGRISEASVSSTKTGVPRRGRAASSAAAQTTKARYGMSM
jgi:hypothetical protein